MREQCPAKSSGACRGVQAARRSARSLQATPACLVGIGVSVPPALGAASTPPVGGTRRGPPMGDVQLELRGRRCRRHQRRRAVQVPTLNTLQAQLNLLSSVVGAIWAQLPADASEAVHRTLAEGGCGAEALDSSLDVATAELLSRVLKARSASVAQSLGR